MKRIAMSDGRSQAKAQARLMRAKTRWSRPPHVTRPTFSASQPKNSAPMIWPMNPTAIAGPIWLGEMPLRHQHRQRIGQGHDVEGVEEEAGADDDADPHVPGRQRQALDPGGDLMVRRGCKPVRT